MKLFQVTALLALVASLSGCAAGTVVTRNGKDVRMVHDDIDQTSAFKSNEVYASLPFGLSTLQFSVQLVRKERDGSGDGTNGVIVYIQDNIGNKAVPEIGKVTKFVAANGDRLDVATRAWDSRTMFGQHAGYELLCGLSDREAQFFVKHQGEDIKVRAVSDQNDVLSGDKVQALADFVTAVIPVPSEAEPFKPFDNGDSLEEKKRKLQEALDKM